MDAKTMLMDYAAKHNDRKVYTDEQFCGKMATEGICIIRTPNSRTIARMSRTGKVISVTETTIVGDAMLVNGKVNETKTTVEIFQISL